MPKWSDNFNTVCVFVCVCARARVCVCVCVHMHQNQNQNQNQNYIINWDHLANAGYFTGFPEQEKKRKRNLSMQSDISTIARKAEKV